MKAFEGDNEESMFFAEEHPVASTVVRGSDIKDDPYKEAEKLGKVVVLPKHDQLFLDLDDAEAVALLDARLDIARQAGLHIDVERSIPSATPGHRHAYCRVRLSGTPYDELTDELRIALQAALGSDRKRELLGLARVMIAAPRPVTVFFENPDEETP